jgi:hypothetical protein
MKKLLMICALAIPSNVFAASDTIGDVERDFPQSDRIAEVKALFATQIFENSVSAFASAKTSKGREWQEKRFMDAWAYAASKLKHTFDADIEAAWELDQSLMSKVESALIAGMFNEERLLFYKHAERMRTKVLDNRLHLLSIEQSRLLDVIQLHGINNPGEVSRAISLAREKNLPKILALRETWLGYKRTDYTERSRKMIKEQFESLMKVYGRLLGVQYSSGEWANICWMPERYPVSINN